MRQALASLLTHRYPALYGATRGPYPFECGDGWFGLLDALSDVLCWRAEVEDRPASHTSQVKEKFGTLRYYWGTTEADDGATDLAEEMSSRISEASGLPGRLGDRAKWWVTRAPGEIEGLVYTQPGLDKRGRMTMPPLGFKLADVVGWRADVLRGPVDVPTGWLDLVDGMLRLLSSQPEVVTTQTNGNVLIAPHVAAYPDTVPVTVTRIGVGADGGLQVDHVGGGLWAEGVVAMAVALSRRLDAATGAAGPVDDNGALLSEAG